MAKIVIQSTEMPNSGRPEVMIRWFCVEFGLGGKEENDISAQILKEFAMAAQQNKGLTSSELSTALNKVIVESKPIARSTVIYHLNRFIEAGLVIKRGRYYHLRATEMAKAVEEIQYDIEREMSKMLNTAREFDKLMSGMFGMQQEPPQDENNMREQ